MGDASADEARAVTLAPAILARYAGDYNAGPLGILTIVNDGRALPDLGVSIRFLKGPDGNVTHLRVTIVEGDIDARRVAGPSK